MGAVERSAGEGRSPRQAAPPTPLPSAASSPPACHRGESPKSAQEAPAAAPAPGEPMDLNTAIQLVLKKALAHDGLARGLHESARAIERGQAQLAILADDCNQPDYKKLIEALCAEQSVNLISVPEQQTLGQWAGASCS